jgi:hypothetical protein
MREVIFGLPIDQSIERKELKMSRGGGGGTPTWNQTAHQVRGKRRKSKQSSRGGKSRRSLGIPRDDMVDKATRK